MNVDISSKIALVSMPVMAKVNFGLGRGILGRAISGAVKLNKLRDGREKLIRGKFILPSIWVLRLGIGAETSKEGKSR